MGKYDVTALGEILIDFTYSGKSENGNTLFEHNPGGAPANLLAVVQKMGGKTAFIGKAGNDMHGHFLKNTLDEIGISTEGFIIDDNYFTTLAFVNLSPTGERSFSFARKPGADTMLTPDEIRMDIIENSKVFHIGSLSLTDEPSKSATFAALECAKKSGCIISYDPNYRDKLWGDEERAIKEMRSVLSYVDIIKVSDEETRLLTDEEDPEKAAKALLDKGVSCVIVTLGANGAYIATKDAAVHSSGNKVKVIDTTGAGDSFMGAFLSKLTENNKKPSELTEKNLISYAEFANKVAAFVVGKRGSLKIMPTPADIK